MAAKKEVKKTTDAKEVLTAEARQSKLVELKKEAMNLRFQHAAGQLPKTHTIRKNRREIARVKTAIAAGNK